MKNFTHSTFFIFLLSGTVRLFAQTAGIPDFTFGQNGQVLLATPDSLHYSGSIALMPNGNIMVAANISDFNLEDTDFWIARLLTDGSPDPEFGEFGHVRYDFDHRDDTPLACLLQPDGKFLVCGNSLIVDVVNKAIAVRFNPDGTLDTTFGKDGVVLVDLGDDEDIFYDMLLLPDGKILFGGATLSTNNPGYYDLLLVQLLPDGSPDPDFGTGGVATANFTFGLEAILAFARQDDGKIVTVGGRLQGTNDMEIARFNANGSVDTTFANKGVLVVDISGHEEAAYDVVVQPDQKIVFCGATFQNNTISGTITLMRLLPNGAFDPEFGTGGQVFTNVNSIEFARSLVLQPDGKILVGVESTAVNNPPKGGLFWVLRYDTNGALDNSFGQGGKTQSENFENYTEVSAIRLQPDGKILLAGTADDQIAVLRFDNDIVSAQAPATTRFNAQLSPNPATGQVLLEWTLTQSAAVSAELYDESGKLVQAIFQPAHFPEGVHKKTFDPGAALPSGRYTVVGRVGAQTFSLPLIWVAGQ